MEGGDIDVNRVIDGHLLPDDYLCSICRNVLWKPGACSSCGHLFCEKCIYTRLEYSNGARKCPFRCENFQQRACAPEFYASLSQLKVRCRNASFGCWEVLDYDRLERHENIECEYLTKTCPRCGQVVLTSELNEHVQVPGKCTSCPILCTICKELVAVDGFTAHFAACYNEHFRYVFVRSSIERAQRNREEGGIVNQQQRDIEYLQNLMFAASAYEVQRRYSRLPTRLKGVDMVQQARERGCGHLYHIYLMILFLLMNIRKAPYLFLVLMGKSFGAITFEVCCTYLVFLKWVLKNMMLGLFIIVCCSGLLGFGCAPLFRMVNDTWIISCFYVVLFVKSCTFRGALESLEGEMMDLTICNIFKFAFGIAILKLCLWVTRLFFWYVPATVAADIFTITNILCAFVVKICYKSIEARNVDP